MELTFEVTLQFDPPDGVPSPTADDVELALADKLGDELDDLIVTVKPTSWAN